MAYDPKQIFNNPTLNRSEMELFLAHPKMEGQGATAFYVGKNIENMEYTIAVETTEKKTIAEPLPTVSNKDGGITFSLSFEVVKGEPAYDAIVSTGLLGKVNDEFDVFFLYGFIGVKQSEQLVEDAPFAQKAKAKITMSAIGGEGTEIVKVTAEGKTSGTIQRGYMKLTGEGDALNYDPDNRTWKTTAFTQVPDLDIGDLIIGGAAA